MGNLKLIQLGNPGSQCRHFSEFPPKLWGSQSTPLPSPRLPLAEGSSRGINPQLLHTVILAGLKEALWQGATGAFGRTSPPDMGGALPASALLPTGTI